MRVVVSLVCAVLTVPLVGASQSAMPSTPHNMSSGPTIDGKTNPAAIPDAVAYRLILNSFSRPSTASAQELNHQSAQLRSIKMTDIDTTMLQHELTDFDVQYHAMVQSYNAEATKLNASGKRADIVGFLAQRDQLVQSFVNEIQSRLSPQGWTTFQTFVQGEKVHMKISSPMGGQQ